MSLRGPFSQAVDDAVRDATNEGILVVVAAGNDFSDACKLMIITVLILNMCSYAYICTVNKEHVECISFTLICVGIHQDHHLMLSLLEGHNKMMTSTFDYLMAPIMENVFM